VKFDKETNGYNYAYAIKYDKILLIEEHVDTKIS